MALMRKQLPVCSLQIDEFQFNYTLAEKPHIQNDMVTLGIKSSRDHRVKLAISYALGQSTKLSVFENRVVAMVLETKNLPATLAQNGRVRDQSAAGVPVINSFTSVEERF